MSVSEIRPAFAASATPPARPPARPASPRPDEAETLRIARARADDLTRSVQQSRVDARDAVKTRAREKLEQLTERLKLIKKLYAANPTEMARQLARLVKELNSELKAYAEAAKANGEFVSAPGAEDSSAAKSEAEARAMQAQADLDFTKLAKGFLKGSREELQTARIRASSTGGARAEPFKEADKALKEIDRDLQDLESAAQADLPIPGLRLNAVV